MKNLDEINHLITIEDLEHIRTTTAYLPWYHELLVNNIFILRKLLKTRDLVQRYLKELGNSRDVSNTIINRSFVHIHLAAWLKSLDLLESIEEGVPPNDFILKNGLKIELSRPGADQEAMIVSGLHRIIRNSENLRSVSISLHIKELSVKKVLGKLKSDLANISSEKVQISNDLYDLAIKDRSDNILSYYVPGTGATCLTSRDQNDLTITFTQNKTDLIKLIEDKLNRAATKSSHILILDFTDSILIKDEDAILSLFESIKQGGQNWHVSLIAGVIFTHNNNVLQVTCKYIVRDGRNDAIKDFEKKFLQSEN